MFKKFDTPVLKRFDFSKTKIALSRNKSVFFLLFQNILNLNFWIYIYTSNKFSLNIFYTSFNNSLWFNCLYFFFIQTSIYLDPHKCFHPFTLTIIISSWFIEKKKQQQVFNLYYSVRYNLIVVYGHFPTYVEILQV